MIKIILTLFVSMIMLFPAYASEEIQLATALTESNSAKATAEVDTKAKAKEENDDLAAYWHGMSERDRIAAGLFIAGAIAVIFNGENKSTTNH